MKKQVKTSIVAGLLVLIASMSFAQSQVLVDNRKELPGEKGIISNLRTAYPLGINDILKVTYYEYQSFDNVGKEVEVAVQDDGTIYLPLIGEVHALGHTTVQLERIVLKMLEKYISKPMVRIQVVEFRSRHVIVLGSVYNQGVYPLLQATTISKFLAQYGGVHPEADLTQVSVIRKNGDLIKVDLKSYYDLGDDSQDILLMTGDKVYIPKIRESVLIKIVRIVQILNLALQVVVLVIVIGQ